LRREETITGENVYHKRNRRGKLRTIMKEKRTPLPDFWV
jgi:hypothetical protein